jgi:hypothetical protein
MTGGNKRARVCPSRHHCSPRRLEEIGNQHHTFWISSLHHQEVAGNSFLQSAAQLFFAERIEPRHREIMLPKTRRARDCPGAVRERPL